MRPIPLPSQRPTYTTQPQTKLAIPTPSKSHTSKAKLPNTRTNPTQHTYHTHHTHQQQWTKPRNSSRCRASSSRTAASSSPGAASVCFPLLFSSLERNPPFLLERTLNLLTCVLSTTADKREFLRISQAVGMGFLIMGVIGYIVKLSKSRNPFSLCAGLLCCCSPVFFTTEMASGGGGGRASETLMEEGKEGRRDEVFLYFGAAS